jgi:hypothetical protein
MLPRGAAAGSPSPEAFEVRNLPAGGTRALDPVVALAQAGIDLQEDLEHGGIGLGGELALPPRGGWSSRRAGRAEHDGRRLLIDREEDRTLRAVLVGMLREAS